MAPVLACTILCSKNACQTLQFDPVAKRMWLHNEKNCYCFRRPRDRRDAEWVLSYGKVEEVTKSEDVLSWHLHHLLRGIIQVSVFVCPTVLSKKFTVVTKMADWGTTERDFGFCEGAVDSAAFSTTFTITVSWSVQSKENGKHSWGAWCSLYLHLVFVQDFPGKWRSSLGDFPGRTPRPVARPRVATSQACQWAVSGRAIGKPDGKVRRLNRVLLSCWEIHMGYLYNFSAFYTFNVVADEPKGWGIDWTNSPWFEAKT